MLYGVEYKEQYAGPVKRRVYGTKEDAMRAAKDRSLAKVEVFKCGNGKRTLLWARAKG